MSADRDRAAASRDAPSDELVGIVIDAGRRGFSRRRVAVALGISGPALARIEQIDAHEDAARRRHDLESGRGMSA
jgi:hypothetical protein